jgi:hypothetical protein
VYLDECPACAARALAHEPGVLQPPVDARLVVVRYDSPVSFDRARVPRRTSVKALLADASVVAVAPTDSSECFELAYPLHEVCELRFRRADAHCASEPTCACACLRLVRELDGTIAIHSCAPIVVVGEG